MVWVGVSAGGGAAQSPGDFCTRRPPRCAAVDDAACAQNAQTAWNGACIFAKCLAFCSAMHACVCSCALQNAMSYRLCRSYGILQQLKLTAYSTPLEGVILASSCRAGCLRPVWCWAHQFFGGLAPIARRHRTLVLGCYILSVLPRRAAGRQRGAGRVDVRRDGVCRAGSGGGAEQRGGAAVGRGGCRGGCNPEAPHARSGRAAATPAPG